MDGDILRALLEGTRPRQFWVKPVGDPAEKPDERKAFSDEAVDIQFAREPAGVHVGDVFIVYRIGVSKILYLAECRSKPRLASDKEIRREPWRAHWRWTVAARNLTPEYGSAWSDHNLRPFSLAKQFNSLYPDEQQSLGAINFGSDKLQVARPFAHFVIRRMLEQVAG